MSLLIVNIAFNTVIGIEAGIAGIVGIDGFGTIDAILVICNLTQIFCSDFCNFIRSSSDENGGFGRRTIFVSQLTAFGTNRYLYMAVTVFGGFIADFTPVCGNTAAAGIL